ncbi:shikimate kinase [Aquimarina sp. ERC-38]|uniref:shikimate kinase n=1 Tax=Aquimarina sp. ERC-38 TaxID=2949996 RepID=UPI0022458909|nr:shikimate kinase [Aquimarina sp. ERC-38]UZO80889.1 shikimate kinase [Aquimarina sp. ERC-38]
MNIVLIGYMGSGKTSVGNLLAEKLDFSFQDLDQFIEENEKITVPEIFKKKSEVYFRKKEAFYLKELLSKSTKSIISLGGGTPCFGTNMDSIKADTQSKSIYLEASIGELANRLFPFKTSRPLIAHLQTKTELEEFIAKHLFERAYYYNQCDFKIKTDGKEIDTLVNEISDLF